MYCGASISVSALELEHGLLSGCEDVSKLTHWFRREVEDIRHQVNEQKIKDYVDLVDVNPILDMTLTNALDDIKDNKMQQVVGHEAIHFLGKIDTAYLS